MELAPLVFGVVFYCIFWIDIVVYYYYYYFVYFEIYLILFI
jgi:hypothetical protein